MTKLVLNSIAEEATACRAAFKDIPVGALVVHCHHESLFEFLNEPAENRINYILSSKSQCEQALRLHLFRPVNTKLLPKKRQEACAKWQEEDAGKLHAKICKNCPWDEQQKTIFPKAS